MEQFHTTKAVAARLGMTANVVRYWVKRGLIVAPATDSGGRLLFRESDIEAIRAWHAAQQARRRFAPMAATEEKRA